RSLRSERREFVHPVSLRSAGSPDPPPGRTKRKSTAGRPARYYAGIHAAPTLSRFPEVPMRRVSTGLLALIAGAAFAAAPEPYHLVKTIPIPGDGGWDYVTVDAAARRGSV